MIVASGISTPFTPSVHEFLKESSEMRLYMNMSNSTRTYLLRKTCPQSKMLPNRKEKFHHRRMLLLFYSFYIWSPHLLCKEPFEISQFPCGSIFTTPWQLLLACYMYDGICEVGLKVYLYQGGTTPFCVTISLKGINCCQDNQNLKEGMTSRL